MFEEREDLNLAWAQGLCVTSSKFYIRKLRRQQEYCINFSVYQTQCKIGKWEPKYLDRRTPIKNSVFIPCSQISNKGPEPKLDLNTVTIILLKYIGITRGRCIGAYIVLRGRNCRILLSTWQEAPVGVGQTCESHSSSNCLLPEFFKKVWSAGKHSYVNGENHNGRKKEGPRIPRIEPSSRRLSLSSPQSVSGVTSVLRCELCAYTPRASLDMYPRASPRW